MKKTSLKNRITKTLTLCLAAGGAILVNPGYSQGIPAQSGSVASFQAPGDTALNNFRTVFLSDGKKSLHILDNVNELLSMLNPLQGNDRYNFTMKPGYFGGSDSINLQTNQDKKIISIQFIYSNDTAYKHELKIYKTFIGFPGKEFLYTGPDKIIHATVWEDFNTRFELVEVIAGKNKRSYSVIYDKLLFYNSRSAKPKRYFEMGSIELIGQL